MLEADDPGLNDMGFKAWRRRHIIARHAPPPQLWLHTVVTVPVLRALAPAELARLRDWATLFIHSKHIEGARGFAVNDYMRLVIAAQACLLILNLDLDDYAGWHTVLVYPDTFIVDRQETDAAGVVHRRVAALCGEAWSDAGVILSWADLDPAVSKSWSASPVLHEFAHKLDMANGVANGMPPLHRNMRPAEWTASLSAAYRALRHDLAHGADPWIDPYAASAPGEFFAVATECFFTAPQRLLQHAPAVYGQLRLFYRQDPAARILAGATLDG